MIKLQFKFNKLITLSLNHDYFDSGKAKFMTVNPTVQTALKLEKHGLLERYRDNELVILFDKEKEDLLADKLEKAERLELNFWVHCSDTSLVNYTSLPLNLHEGILCFENSRGSELHQLDHVSEKEFVKTFQPGEIISDDYQEIELLDNDQNVIYSATSKEQPVCYMPAVGTGIYHIRKDKKQTEKIVCLSERVKRKPVGLINIVLDKNDCKKITGDISKGDDPQTRDYEIHFKARETYWKYLIVSKYVNGIKEARIETNDKEIKFSKPQTTDLITGQKAVSFESAIPLAMHEFTHHHFQLVRKSTGMGNKVILKHMPAPAPDRIIPESRSADSKVYSEILIYV
ncbi:hypothetical protein OO013_02430 [Mangrovivirga sp. M17]|uniref:Uncharacterized protein n=1 Tax=Mangrovivirga halotolerans TaxID=2993936 RepID=A0ABT3RN64_9BACT|nr:hypothetical protein [Mangrovivirga halotolerans]MCX2742702.1 hypothetical protein [Mangrovivirga halotolerans]